MQMECRKKIRASHKGENNPFFGKKHSKETKRKISELSKGRKFSEQTRKKLSEANKGRKHSLEMRRKVSEATKGKKNPNWNGGVSTEDAKIRGSVEYHLWREAIYTRDIFTCQKCNDGKGGTLNAHHIRNFSKIIELRTSIENGITFCITCHKEFHKRYGIKKNNQQQINEFLNII